MFQVNPLIHMKIQVLFSSKEKGKKIKCRLLQFLFGALRVEQSCALFEIITFFRGGDVWLFYTA